MLTLVLTNDFPPRIGGIEVFVRTCCDLLDGDVVVLTSATRGREADEQAYDATLAFPVYRIAPVLLPTPATLRWARSLIRGYGCTRILYGSAAPLGLLAGSLAPLVEAQVALTHGHETWYARMPLARESLRSAGRSCVVTANSRFVARQIEPWTGPVTLLPPPLDTHLFHQPDATPEGPPVVLAAARLVPRKGFDVLLRAWPTIYAEHPEARLRLIGDGPDRVRIARLAAGLPAVELVGAVVREAMPAQYARASVFALPVRTRYVGLEPEGFGYVFAEAAACGLPVVVGRSGGAPETCVDGVSGHVVEGRDAAAVARAIGDLLDNPVRARNMGHAGCSYVSSRFGLATARLTLRAALAVTD